MKQRDRAVLENMLDVIDFSRDKNGKLKTDDNGCLLFESINGAQLPAGYKRRNAYVSEFYFEKVILPNLVKGDMSLGWIRFYEYADPQKVCWIKIIPDFKSNSTANADKAFISSFKGIRSHRFFILDVEEQKGFKLYELSKNSTGQRAWKSALKMANNSLRLVNTERMANAITEIQTDLKKSVVSGELGFSRKWLQKESTEDLFLLLCNRLLVNYGLYGPCDIDAVEISNSGKIIMHEFKRKYPFKRTAYHFIPSQHANLEFRQSLGNKINEMLIGEGILEVSDKQKRLTLPKKAAYRRIDEYITSKLFKAFDMTKYPSGYFGLDKSHCDTTDICFEENFEYLHTIWWSETGQDIDDLLKNSREAKESPNIYSGKISKNSLEGFTRTVGEDSGTFDHSTRIQYVFAPATLTEKIYCTDANTRE